jgi:hypothetical protein
MFVCFGPLLNHISHTKTHFRAKDVYAFFKGTKHGRGKKLVTLKAFL